MPLVYQKPNLNQFHRPMTRKDFDAAMNVLFGTLDPKKILMKQMMSKNWLFKKLLKPEVKKISLNEPLVGRMFLYKYDAKTKEKLRYWDRLPLIIMVQEAPNGFYGINFHYLHYDLRIKLFKLIMGYKKASLKDKNEAVIMTYNRLKSLGTTKWKFAFKRYLLGYCRSKMIEIPFWEWENVLRLPIAQFQKASMQQVWRESLLYR